MKKINYYVIGGQYEHTCPGAVPVWANGHTVEED